ncbi:MAG TPA: hypothetical protein VK448_01980 [Dissulfurispiraceae bacterium]|nr:hypothetical protein [Dissulfurispiraceae bacterium]
MSLNTLAEAIILQAAEDFLNGQRSEDDIAFFGGEGFRLCSEIAGMEHSAKCLFLDLIRKSAPAACCSEKSIAYAGAPSSLSI